MVNRALDSRAIAAGQFTGQFGLQILEFPFGKCFPTENFLFAWKFQIEIENFKIFPMELHGETVTGHKLCHRTYITYIT